MKRRSRLPILCNTVYTEWIKWQKRRKKKKTHKRKDNHTPPTFSSSLSSQPCLFACMEEYAPRLRGRQDYMRRRLGFPSVLCRAARLRRSGPGASPSSPPPPMRPRRLGAPHRAVLARAGGYLGGRGAAPCGPGLGGRRAAARPRRSLLWPSLASGSPTPAPPSRAARGSAAAATRGHEGARQQLP